MRIASAGVVMQGMDDQCPDPPLTAMQLWDDRATPRPGAWNMATDEAMLGLAAAWQTAILRFYRWSEPTLSFGYFINIRDALTALHPGEKLIRRWTGGGLVHHENAVTWSLAIPREMPFCQERPAASYARLHRAVAQVLTQAGCQGITVVSAEATAPTGGLCATAPAPGDVLWNDRKIAGAGQRRTRSGLLHQGVLFLPEPQLPDNFPRLLAQALSPDFTEFPALEKPLDLPGRYEATEWTHR